VIVLICGGLEGLVVAAMLAEAEEKSKSVDWLTAGAGAAHTDKSITPPNST